MSVKARQLAAYPSGSFGIGVVASMRQCFLKANWAPRQTAGRTASLSALRRNTLCNADTDFGAVVGCSGGGEQRE